MIEIVYYLSGLLATVALVGVFVGLIRPGLFRKFVGRHATRAKLPLLFFGLMMVLGGVAAATEPASIKQARLQKEHQAQIAKAEEHAQKLATEHNQVQDKLATEAQEATRQAEVAKLAAEVKALQELPMPPAPAPAPAAPVAAPKPAPVPVPQPTTSCDPNYSPCIRNVPGNTLNCPDIGVMVQVVGADHHKFDANNDGYGCESYGNR